MRRGVLVLLSVTQGCAPALTSQGARVSVYQVPAEARPPDAAMPDGCRLLGSRPPVSMTEAEIAGQKDPYRVARNEAGAAGANALLVRKRLAVPRRTFDCPVASPITDCPGNEGAWFDIAFEDYACTPEALHDLDARRPSPRPRASAPAG